jgi:hypothetical protein
VIAIGLGTLQTILGSALQQAPRWEIFDSGGNQLGINYVNYSIERYRYARRASAGATLLIVEVSLKEIRQVTASYAKRPTQIVSRRIPQQPHR